MNMHRHVETQRPEWTDVGLLRQKLLDRSGKLLTENSAGWTEFKNKLGYPMGKYQLPGSKTLQAELFYLELVVTGKERDEEGSRGERERRCSDQQYRTQGHISLSRPLPSPPSSVDDLALVAACHDWQVETW